VRNFGLLELLTFSSSVKHQTSSASASSLELFSAFGLSLLSLLWFYTGCKLPSSPSENNPAICISCHPVAVEHSWFSLGDSTSQFEIPKCWPQVG